jgi:hypothetical protein
MEGMEALREFKTMFTDYLSLMSPFVGSKHIATLCLSILQIEPLNVSCLPNM